VSMLSPVHAVTAFNISWFLRFQFRLPDTKTLYVTLCVSCHFYHATRNADGRSTIYTYENDVFIFHSFEGLHSTFISFQADSAAGVSCMRLEQAGAGGTSGCPCCCHLSPWCPSRYQNQNQNQPASFNISGSSVFNFGFLTISLG